MQQKMLSELWDVEFDVRATKEFVGILPCRLPGPQPIQSTYIAVLRKMALKLHIYATFYDKSVQ